VRRGSERWTCDCRSPVQFPAISLPAVISQKNQCISRADYYRIYTPQINSALHPSGVAKSSTCFGFGKDMKVTTAAGLQVTLCHTICHVISHSGVVYSRSVIFTLGDGRSADACDGVECKLQGQKCVVDKRGRTSCVCNTVCSYKQSPVCASNGRTYYNQCVMDAEACVDEVPLRVVTCVHNPGIVCRHGSKEQYLGH